MSDAIPVIDIGQYPPLTPAEYMAWFNRNNYRHMAGKSA